MLTSPAWSPDYSKIAYLDVRMGPGGQHQGLALMDPAGRDLGTVAGSGVYDQVTAFAWAPDGRSLAVGRSGGRASRQEVDLIGLDGRRRLVAKGYFSALAFSPDGPSLIGLKGLVLDTDLFLLPVKPGGRTRQLTHYAAMVRRKPVRICGNEDGSTGWGPRGDLFWSRDGKWVAFTDSLSHRTATGWGVDAVALEVSTGRRVIMASTPYLNCKERMGNAPPSASLVLLGWI
jgi:Tol biopolymer transport system component